MARIPTAELERLKREVDLVALVEGSGVVLRRHGRDLVGRCPWHQDREPSLVVSPGKGLWRCLGACQVGGSALDWLMRAEGIGLAEAIARLVAPRLPRRCVPAPPPVIASVEPVRPDLLARVAALYAETLARTPAALAYLARRGLADRAAIDHFRIGYADGTLAARLAAELAGLRALGLVRADGREHLGRCVVVSLVSLAGEIVGLYGRRIDGGPIRHVYLPGPRRGLVNPAAFTGAGELVLCEAVLDAVTFWRHGIRQVTAAYGVNGVSADLHQALRARQVARVAIAFDADDAGERAAQALAARLAVDRIGCRRVVLPAGLDVNAYALAVSRPREALAALLAAARPIPAAAEACA